MEYDVLRRYVRKYAEERIVTGCMNALWVCLVSGNGEMLPEFTDKTNLERLNETVAEGRLTWNANSQKCAINYVW